MTGSTSVALPEHHCRSRAPRRSRHGWVPRPRAAAALLALFMFTASQSAEADNASAKELFHQAQDLYDSGEYEGALPLFREVYAQTSSPNARLYIARALRDAGHTTEAYEEMVEVATEAARRAETEPKYEGTHTAALKELLKLEAQVARLTLAIADTPEGTEITINGEPYELDRLGSEVALMPGAIVVKVTAPGRDLVRRSLELSGGESKTLAMALPAPREGAEEEDEEEDEEEEGGGGGMSPVRAAGIGVAGLGVAGIVVFAVTGSMSKSKFEEVETACEGKKCTEDSFAADIDDGKTLETIANISLIAGGVLIAAGVTMIVVGEDEDNDETLRFGVVPLLAGADGSTEIRGGFVSLSSRF